MEHMPIANHGIREGIRYQGIVSKNQSCVAVAEGTRNMKRGNKLRRFIHVREGERWKMGKCIILLSTLESSLTAAN